MNFIWMFSYFPPKNLEHVCKNGLERLRILYFCTGSGYFFWCSIKMLVIWGSDWSIRCERSPLELLKSLFLDIWRSLLVSCLCYCDHVLEQIAVSCIVLSGDSKWVALWGYTVKRKHAFSLKRLISISNQFIHIKSQSSNLFPLAV